MKKLYDEQNSYYRKAKRFKVLMFCLVAFILVGLIAIQQFYQMKPAVITTATQENKMVEPHYFGLDEKDRPFEITAQEAVQSPDNVNVYNLKNPEAYVNLGQGKWTKIKANKGVFNQGTKYLVLEEDVGLYRDDGQEFHTAEANIDFNIGKVFGDKNVEGNGPKGKMSSKGFEVLDYGQRYIFNGRTKLLLPLNTIKTGQSSKG